MGRRMACVFARAGAPPNLLGYCSARTASLHSPVMAQHSSTLNLGDRAPDFTLFSANGMGEISLAQLLQRGPVVIEFLRGTW